LGADKAATAKWPKIYWSKNILAGPCFLSGLMVIDRVALQTATSPKAESIFQVTTHSAVNGGSGAGGEARNLWL